ncbi:MAG: diacylglycerol kinase family protein [Candidatus Poseidoniales archaeon]
MGLFHCIVNPASRDYRCGKQWPKIRAAIEQRGHEVKEYMTQHVGHASHLSREIRTRWEEHGEGGEAEGKPPVVVSVGGDGVAHEVASGIRGSDLILAQIPFGSGNDFCITNNISRKNLDQAIDVLEHGIDRHCGAWRLEGFACEEEKGYPVAQQNPWDGSPHGEGRIVRWVFLESDAGITSAISRAKLRRAKWLKGPKKYTYLGVTTIPVWPRRKIQMQIDDLTPWQGDITMFTATTGETFGGGYKVNPGMYPTREKGLVVFAPKLSRLSMLQLMGPVKKGKHIGKWGIYQQDAMKIELWPLSKNGTPSDRPLHPPTYIQADGEPLIQLPATLEWHRNQIVVRGATQVDWPSE